MAKSVRSLKLYVPTTEPLAILESEIRLFRLFTPACRVCRPMLHDKSSMMPSCCPRLPTGRDGPIPAKPGELFTVVVLVGPPFVVLLPLAPPSAKPNAVGRSVCASLKSAGPVIAEYQLPLRMKLFTRLGVMA